MNPTDNYHYRLTIAKAYFDDNLIHTLIVDKDTGLRVKANFVSFSNIVEYNSMVHIYRGRL